MSSARLPWTANWLKCRHPNNFPRIEDLTFKQLMGNGAYILNI